MRSTLDDRYLAEDGLVHLTGIQALARLPLDVRRADKRAGRTTAVFISGYEGSPLAGYDLELARNQKLLDDYGIVFRPAVNEELAATAVQGTQLASASPDRRVEGVTGIWYGKSPGLDRATDALRHANLMGTHHRGGAVALVGDDPAAKSSTVPGASELLLADLGMPTLYPADPQEALDLGLHAVAMSRASGLWTAMKIATNVADGSGTVRVHPDRVIPVLPDSGYRHEVTAHMIQPVLGELERSRDGIRLQIAAAYAAANGLNQIVRGGADGGRAGGDGGRAGGDGGRAGGDGSGAGGADRVGIVAAGKTFLDLRQALRILGFDDAELARRGVRLLKLGMIYPLEPSVVADFAAGLTEIIVVEEKRPHVETAIKDLLYGRAAAPAVSGKRDGDGTALFPRDGELDPDMIARGLAGRLAAIGQFPSAERWLRDTRDKDAADAREPRQRTGLPLVARTPYFCSGCPHNSSTKAPEGSLVGAGIGCHAMVTLMDPGQVGKVAGLTQMGGEGAQWIGMAPFVTQRHLLQNIGDGTFHHSGSLAVRAAVAAGANITYKILYNSAVAMTGGQRPAGVLSVPDMARALAAEGVRQIIITTEEPGRYRRASLPRGTRVWHRDRLIEAQEALAKAGGVTVLIHDQECATELRRKRRRGLAPEPARRVLINERVCEGCGDCGQKSNCLSVQPVQTEFGRKTQIDQSSCNKDYSCLKGDCPAFLVVEPGPGRGKGIAARRLAPALDAASLPEPPSAAGTRPAAAGRPAGNGHAEWAGHPAAAGRAAGDGDTARAGGAGSFPGTHTTRITGIGGSGVVTLSQILSVAATLAGWHVRALDQTGLAQKGGAVVSDVKITAGPVEQAHKAAQRECDLYLGCDLLVAADPAYLAAADPGRTVAVVSTAEVPTGQMVIDTSAAFPALSQLTGRIRDATRCADAVFLNARQLSEALLGDDQYANILLAGAAYQAGALPVPAGAIEEAIRINGVRADANVQAFRRGRQAVADPAALAATLAELRGGHAGSAAAGAGAGAGVRAGDADAMGTSPERMVDAAPASTVPRGAERTVDTGPGSVAPGGAAGLARIVRAEPGSELARLTAIRVPDLAAYQDAAYAREYAETVERVRAAEARHVPGSTELAEAVARYLYKLMAYKDEYEVARLSLDPAAAAAVRAQFGEGARVSYLLHPPLLRAMGMSGKIALGPWFRPAFRVLAASRRLRGTRLDVFGYTRVRRTERALVTQYREVVDELLANLSPGTHGLATQIASLPDMVRGYEDVKLASVRRYQERLADLRHQLTHPVAV
ncbi:MAG TPA: indolepyruvate ferredoxin oxidoreductase family protein [Streptosporangiaceae bacterium]|nr:indolepyruvate ferredoxin oxidoreductase family protein [Streptosporangiaceae bacterium]